MSEIILSLRGVCLVRGARNVLSDVSFEVRRGELVALMGPSGAGKTTTLRVIAGLETFQAGSVHHGDLVFGPGNAHSPPALKELRRKVGLVFQFHHLFEHLPVLRNVCLAPVHAQRLPLGEAERRARELLQALGVDHRAKAYPRELSGGEAQRVAIARALALNPPLLLLDEPTASLDAGRRGELAEMVRNLGGNGRTVIIATHDKAFARSCSARVLQIEGGTIAEACECVFD